MPDLGFPIAVIGIGVTAAVGLAIADKVGLLGGASASGAATAGSAGADSSAGAVTGNGAVAGASLLTPGQQDFASRFQADTGFDPAFISAWLLSEESSSAAAGRQSSNDQDWLNIGRTDSHWYGVGDGIWSDPISAADASAAWLKGSADAVPGFGKASPGVQAIAQSAGQSAEAQMQALQNSGWATGGYPDFASILSEVRSAR